MVLELFDRFPATFNVPGDPHLSAVRKFLTRNSDVVRVRDSLDASLRSFDPETATMPRGVFVTGVQLVGASGVSYEGAPTPLLDRVIDLLSVARGEAAEKPPGVQGLALNYCSLSLLAVMKLDFHVRGSSLFSNPHLSLPPSLSVTTEMAQSYRCKYVPSFPLHSTRRLVWWNFGVNLAQRC